MELLKVLPVAILLSVEASMILEITKLNKYSNKKIIKE